MRTDMQAVGWEMAQSRWFKKRTGLAPLGGGVEESSTHTRRNIYVMALSNSVGVSANSLWIMFMPYYFAVLGLDEVSIGLVFTGQSLALACMALIGGRLADRLGRKPIIIVGTFVYILGPLLLLLIETTMADIPTAAIPLVVTVYIMMFAGSGTARPATSMLLIESSPKKHRGLSYMMASTVLPSIPPALLVVWGAMLYDTGRFQEALMWGFVGLVIMWLIEAVFLRETLSGTVSLQKHDHDIPAKSLRNGGGISLFLVVMMVAFAFDQAPSEGLRWYIPLFLGENSELLFGFMTSISTLVIAVSALGSGYLVDRIGPRVVLIAKWSIIPILATLFPFLQDILLIIAVYALWTGLGLLDASVPPLLVADAYPEEKRGSVLGTFSMGLRLLSTTGSTIITLALLLGPAVPFFLKALMNVCGLILILGFLPKVQPSTQRESEMPSPLSS